MTLVTIRSHIGLEYLYNRITHMENFGLCESVNHLLFQISISWYYLVSMSLALNRTQSVQIASN